MSDELQDGDREHLWPLRKWTDPKITENVTERSARRKTILQKTADADLPRKRKNFCRNDTVHFLDELDAGEEVVSCGWVKTNDPFLNQMWVWVAESEDQEAADQDAQAQCVSYRNICARPVKVERPDDAGEDVTQPEVTEEPAVIAVRRKKAAPVADDSPIIADALKFFISQSGTEVELVRAPCENGVLRQGARVSVVCCAGNVLFNVERLFCDVTIGKSMAELKSVDNSLISMKIPALLVALEDDSKDDIMPEVPDNLTAVQTAFLVYSAIKRALRIAVRSKNTTTFAIVASTPLTKKIIGMTTKEVVSHKKSNIFFYLYIQN